MARLSHFPDGQLFADLHGGSSHPVGPIRVLERFLRALGVPGSQMPEGLDERAEVYRSLLAHRKVLVVLDDAVGESQVSPLLPGSGTAAVIITSRRRLAGLAGAAHVEVDVFDADKSLDLLGRIAGSVRVQHPVRGRGAGRRAVRPPAAGAAHRRRPAVRAAALERRAAGGAAGRRDAPPGRAEARRDGHPAEHLAQSYEGASEQARRLFRRLALLDLPVFSGWMSAALLDLPLARAEDLLDDLVTAQLVEAAGTGSGVHSHYRFHDLIRVFARERLAAEEPAAEREAALERALGALLYLAEQAHRHYYGGDYILLHSDARRWPLPARLAEQLVSDPLSWYDRERAVLVAGVRQAAQAGFTDLCWSLALTAVALFESRACLDDWQETHDIALEATRKARHLRGQAAMLYSTGELNQAQQRFDRARQLFTAAAQLFTDAGDDQGMAHVTRLIASADRLSGRLDDAARGYEQALAMFRRTGDKIAIAYVLYGLAQVKLELDEVDSARELLSEALRLTQTVPCTRIEAQVLHRIGEAHLLAGDLTGAVGAFELALARTCDIGDLIGEAYVLTGLGVTKVRQGESGQARDALQRSLELAGTTEQPLTEARALLGLSELALTSGDPGQAVAFAQRAAGAFRGMGTPLYEARALTLLGDAHAALGNRAAADAASAQATALRAKLADKPRWRSRASDGGPAQPD